MPFLASLALITSLSAPPAPGAAPPTPPVDPGNDETQPMSAFSFADYEIDDPFWMEAQRVNARVTLPYVWQMCEKTGRIENFTRAAAKLAGKPSGPYQGYFFNDSDVYKLVEGAYYVLSKRPDDFLELKLQDLVKLIGSAQQPDGYINTFYTLNEGDKRWSDLPQRHELYCLGHLIEAGVAGWQSAGERKLLDTGKRAASHIRTLFGPGKRTDVCGHPEIELALQRLASVTGDPADRELATWFLNQRGQAKGRPSAGAYAQDHSPLREQREVEGHAVRAAYLYTAATQLAREKDDDALAAALRALWRDVVDRKMYATGGIGTSSHNEGFTSPWDLPNDDAYAETCASIGLMLWAHQMHLLDRSAEPIDVLERTLYNAVRGGVSLSGNRFFYSNPLASRGTHHRQPWFDCACCPPNVLRILGRLGDFIATRGDDVVYVNLYVQGSFLTTVRRSTVRLTQRTEYPWSGKVQIWVEATRPPAKFTLALRIPQWCDEATITVNGKPAEERRERGYAFIERDWTTNDIVDFELAMPVRVIAANPNVESQTGRLALARGPLIYCVEGVDSATDLRSLVFDPKQTFETARRADLLGGVTTISGSATRRAAEGAPGDKETTLPFTAVPFYAWDNRDAGPMLVWLPATSESAEKPRDPSIKVSASHCYARDSVEALNDGLVPKNRVPRFSWWPRVGGTTTEPEWVQYEFTTPRTLSSVEMHWFDDVADGGGCATPAAWRVLARRGDAWVPVEAVIDRAPDDAGKGSHPPQQRATFPAVETSGVRLEVTLREGKSAGLLEWSVSP